MNQRKYTEKEKLAYLDKASEIGHSRARRELGYPNSWSTANSWAKEFNVTIALSELKAKSAAFNQWYRDEELLIAMQDVIDRGMEYINDKDDLSPDEYKKTVEGIKRAIETKNLIEGKATSRAGTESAQSSDEVFKNLLSAFEGDEQKVSEPESQEA
ncbi:hypothetical protein GTY86_02065 [Streptomyces sp. SID5770]|uniref:hypothetical protein n=1 Tax=Streptomyces sp. SID5770 TaxID=2690308 RepID=UPI00136FC59F|nr:hypothetical protein [Streptomyces sp. SID5770]MZE50121.1 hypothetical protein [Streptomyces sp. SID5770]